MITDEEMTPEELKKKEYEDQVIATLAEMKSEVEAFGGAEYCFQLDVEGAAYVTNEAMAG